MRWKTANKSSSHWCASFESRDKYTQGHVERVAAYSVEIGIRMGLDDADIATLNRGGVVHDLGKILIAPLDVVLSDEDVLQPDILFVSRGRLGIITDRNVQGAPDLVVEVLSPGTADRDRTLKRARYLRFGVREYWIVDPQSRTIEVLQAGQTDFETVRVFPQSTVATSPLLERTVRVGVAIA